MEKSDDEKSNSVGSRLRAARLLLGLSQKQVAEKAGLSQVSIQHLESGRNENSRHLVNVAQAVGVRPEWLLTGVNPMVSGPIAVARPASPGLHVVIEPLTATFSSEDESEVTPGLPFSYEWLDRQGLDPANLRVVWAEDNSNFPTVSRGDSLLIDRTQVEPRNGQMYAILTPSDDVVVRRLIHDFHGGWSLVPDNRGNPRFPDFQLSDDALKTLNILGIVVWRGGMV
jgi:transcriptional regulator with XRE-family HTH domain